MTLGSVYALFASGYTLTFGVTRSFNFAHVVVFALGAIIAIRLMDSGYSAWLAAVDGAIAGGVAGVTIDLIAGWRFRWRQSGLIAPMVATIAVVGLVVDISPRYIPQTIELPRAAKLSTVHLGSTGLAGEQVAALVLCLAALVALHLLLRATRLGAAIRAVAGNESAARAVGMNVGSVIAQTTFVASLSGAIAGIASALAAHGIGIAAAYALQVPALAAVLIGGSRSVPGAVVGGFAVAGIEVAMSTVIPSPWFFVVPLVVAVAAIVALPRGFLAARALRSA